MEVERVHRRAGWLLTAVGAAALTSWTGCRTTGTGVAALRPSDDGATIDGVMGPGERRLHAAAWEQRRQELQSSGLNVEGLAEFDAAQRLYDAGEYRAAENAFQALAKQRSRAGKTWRDTWKSWVSKDKQAAKGLFGSYGDPIEEDALFMVAESQFGQKRYSWAQDSYGTLLEKYPSTRHLDDVTRRLFFIAQTWLGVPPSQGRVSDVELVEHSDAGTPEPAIERIGGPSSWPIVPNFVNRSRPVFDTHGRALQALESIWRHDASGPLADDALMLQATYYQRKGDYVEAARLYKLVREQYPESTHFQNAFLLGSHVSLASYDGAEYEGAPLSEARQLKESSRHLFANLTEEQKQRLDKELQAIANAEVEREWQTVEFYRKKQQPASVALYCNRILHKYPDSPYAKRAWEMLEQIRPQLTAEEAALFVRGAPRANPAGETEPAGRATLGGPAVEPAAPATPPAEEWWNTPKTPQPAERTPDLRPAGPDGASPGADDPPARLLL